MRGEREGKRVLRRQTDRPENGMNGGVVESFPPYLYSSLSN
jgi:hypothetical protein